MYLQSTIRENGRAMGEMDRDNIYLKMEVFTLVAGKIMRKRERGFLSIPMVMSTQENSVVAFDTARGSIAMPMGISMKGNICIILSMDMVEYSLRMEMSISVCGRGMNSMERDDIYSIREKCLTVNLKMENL